MKLVYAFLLRNSGGSGYRVNGNFYGGNGPTSAQILNFQLIYGLMMVLQV